MKGKPSLIIKNSKIPKSGKGLYTETLIPKGALIGEYKGRLISDRECDRLAERGKDIYLFDVGGGKAIDGLRAVRCKVRYMNDATGFKRIKGLSNNAKFKVDFKQKRVFVYAKRDIKPNEEIFASYGKDYWDTLKYNLNL